MLRRCVLGLLIVSLGTAVLLAGRTDSSVAQQKTPVADSTSDTDVPATNQLPLKPVNPLPISQVVLFNSGVGYFHRTGMVEGDARVDLQFQAGDINDLIKSLVIEDTKGKVLPLRYDSQEPIEKTLRSFAINLSSNPTFAQILESSARRKDRTDARLQQQRPARNAYGNYHRHGISASPPHSDGDCDG